MVFATISWHLVSLTDKMNRHLMKMQYWKNSNQIIAFYKNTGKTSPFLRVLNTQVPDHEFLTKRINTGIYSSAEIMTALFWYSFQQEIETKYKFIDVETMHLVQNI